MDKITMEMLEGLTLEQKSGLLHAQVKAFARIAIVKIITEVIMFLGLLSGVVLIICYKG